MKRLVLVLAAVLAASLAPMVLQAESVELKPTKDTWVDEAEPDAVRAADPELVARFREVEVPAEGDPAKTTIEGKVSRIYIGFDFGSIRNAHVNKASLELTLLSASGKAEIVMKPTALVSNWEERITEANAPGRTRSYEPPVQIGNTANTVITWDVTELLRDTIEGVDSLDGFSLSGIAFESPTYRRTFASREAGENGPSLKVEYVPGQAKRSPTPPPSPNPGEESDVPGAGVVKTVLAVLGGILLIGGAVWFSQRPKAPAAD